MDDCRLDRGSPFCYTAAKNSFAMLDPYWISGSAKHVKRSEIRWVFILRNDKVSPPMVKMDIDDALRILESGESFGAKHDPISFGSQPFYNPHLLMKTPEYLEIQRSFFRRLLENTNCYLFNSGIATSEDIKKIVLETEDKVLS